MRTSWQKLMLGWAGIVLASVVTVFPGKALAQDYGAIAYSPSRGNCGYAYNYSSRGGAESRALAECGRSDCTIAVWFENACGAVARGRDGVMGWAWAGSRSGAERRALAECESRGSGCGIICWSCTDR